MRLVMPSKPLGNIQVFNYYLQVYRMKRWSSTLAIGKGRVKIGDIFGSCYFHLHCLDHSTSVPMGHSYLKEAFWEAYISLEESTE